MKLPLLCSLSLSLSLLLTMPMQAQEAKKLDFLIKNALVFDGTDAEPTKRNVGISGDRITFIGEATETPDAEKTIDATGLYLSPGFIDPHTHNDEWLDSKDKAMRQNLPSLTQGVTTVFLGSDGFGSYQIGKAIERYNEAGVGTNVAQFIGFRGVRSKVIGLEDKKATDEDIKAMRALVAKGMKEGAFGLSTGLFYAPQVYATTEEVIEIAKEAAKYGGIYDTHMRDENRGLIESIRENVEIATKAKIPVMISHIKAVGPAAWGKSEEVIRMIEEAQASGVEIFANQYPYTASQTTLRATLLPPWVQSGGKEATLERLANYKNDERLQLGVSRNLVFRAGDSRQLITRTSNADYVGKTLHEIAGMKNLSPEEAAIELIKEDYETRSVSFCIDPDDIAAFMKKSWVITGSDGGGPHPRTYGSYARKIRKYALEDKVVTLTEAIHKSTGKSAELLRIKERGFIKEGYYADLAIFSSEEIRDNATFEKPAEIASGVHYVFVNGGLAVDGGTPTGILSGRPLKK